MGQQCFFCIFFILFSIGLQIFKNQVQPIHNMHPIPTKQPMAQQPKQPILSSLHSLQSLHSHSSHSSHQPQNNMCQTITNPLIINHPNCHENNNDGNWGGDSRRNCKIRRFQSFNSFGEQGEYGDRAHGDLGMVGAGAGVGRRIGISSEQVSVVIGPKPPIVNPQSRQFPQTSPTHPATSTTRTNTQNFHVPSLQKSPQNPNKIYTQQLEHQNYTYLAIFLFFVFVVCAILPAKQLYHIFMKVVNLGFWGVGIFVGICQIVWEYLL